MTRNGLLSAVGALVLGAVVAWRLVGVGAGLPPLPPLPADPGDLPARMEAELGAVGSEHAALVESLGGFGAAGAEALAAAESRVAALPGAASALHAVVADAQAPLLRRIDACRLLGLLRERRAIPLLGRLLGATDGSAPSTLQAACAEALGAIGDRAALPLLLVPLLDNRPADWHVAAAVGIAALHLGAPAGGDACLDVLEDWSPDLSARPRVFDRERVGLALVALAARLGQPAPADPDPYRLPGDFRAEVRKFRTWWDGARARVTPAAGVTIDAALLRALLAPHLANFSGESFFYRKLAQDVLVQCGADGLPYLLHALRDERAPWRQHAAEALGATLDPVVVPHLVAAYRAEPAAVARLETVKALLRLRADAVLDGAAAASVAATLDLAKRDPDPLVRAAAK